MDQKPELEVKPKVEGPKKRGRKPKTPLVVQPNGTPPAIIAEDFKSGIDTLLESRKYFIEQVLPILKEGQDFFVIKGKKSLAKGGAEKLASIFRFTASFEVDKDIMTILSESGQKGLIAFKCLLKDKDGLVKGEGRGADTIDRNQSDPNKTIKMAQKRAYTDSLIRATGLSDIFTQDLDDMPLESISNGGNGYKKEVIDIPATVSSEPTPNPEPNTLLESIAREVADKKIDHDLFRQYVLARFGKSGKDMKTSELELLKAELKHLNTPVTQPQIARLMAIASSHNFTDIDIKEKMVKFNKTSKTELNAMEYAILVAEVSK